MQRMVYAAVLALLAGGPVVAQAVDKSIRPPVRPITATATLEVTPVARASFTAWVAEFRGRALAQGIRAEVFDRAFRGVSYNDGIVARDRNQAEFTKQIWEYLDTAVSATRIANGQAALRKHDSVLREIEARYGVEKEVVAAIWGLESAYGTFRGSTPIIEALASLAYDPRRSTFFEAQLLDALRIVQAGDVAPANMTGSWAGAMGHTQFMPGSYLAHAVDFTGDGKRDIWGEDPADALASTAAYLKHFGWTTGQPWGVEVRLPEGFDYTETSERIKKPTSDWVARGVVAVSGAPLPDYPRASVLLPAGHTGPAFLIYDNFQVIEKYNTADAYVIAVGKLADRLRGGPAIAAEWPREDRALSFDEKQEMQKRLLAQGFDPEGVDGIIGPRTIAAVQAYQRAKGMVPDGYASLRILKSLRGS